MTHPHLTAWFIATVTTLSAWPSGAQTPQVNTADPYQSLAWSDMHQRYLGGEPYVFDARVQVSGPAFAEDPMNVPISVDAQDLPAVTQIVVLVDRNPIRRVLSYFPQQALLPRVHRHHGFLAPNHARESHRRQHHPEPPRRERVGIAHRHVPREPDRHEPHRERAHRQDERL